MTEHELGATKPPKPAPVKHTLTAVLASGETVELGTGLSSRDAATKVAEAFRSGVTIVDDEAGVTRFVNANQVVEVERTTDEPPAPTV